MPASPSGTPTKKKVALWASATATPPSSAKQGSLVMKRVAFPESPTASCTTPQRLTATQEPAIKLPEPEGELSPDEEAAKEQSAPSLIKGGVAEFVKRLESGDKITLT